MRTTSRLTLFCACVLLALGAQAQRGPGGPGGGRPPGGGGGAAPMGSQSSGFGNPTLHRDPDRDARPPLTQDTRPSAPVNSTPNNTGAHNGLQLGPPGRWWDDRNFAMSIGLTKNQQQKMDNIFNANKGTILEKYHTLQKEESKLEAATHDPQLDRARIFAAIDSVNQARAALAKSYTQMLLQVRQQMDPGQIARMDKFREQTPTE
jgi:Spy/CpxP family protein refolding chaperone